METLNRDWLFQRTGDPFTDSGAWALEAFMQEHPDEDILKLIERAAKIYVNQWSGNIYNVFHNSSITQPSFVTKKIEVEKTVEYYRNLIEGITPHKTGVCRILGRETSLFQAGRQNHILSGGGSFINFHHGFEEGLFLSKEVLIRMLFVPLGTAYIGKYLAVISSNKTELEKEFVKHIVHENLLRVANQTSTEMLKLDFPNPANALFEFIKKTISLYDIPEDETVEVSLFHFSNYKDKPHVTIYSFSARLFKFYRKVLKGERVEDWQRFVRGHYSPPKETVYREREDVFFTERKKAAAVRVEEETVKCFYNSVYYNLLNEKNIRSQMTTWCARQYKAQRPFKLFHIAILYQTFLRDMKEETLKKIEHIADIVVSNNDKRKKWLNTLLRVKNDSTFRDFLLQLIRDQSQRNDTEPVIRLREYDRYFLSDGVYAKETRDLILISVYEKLCDLNIVEEIDETDIPEELTTED